MATVFPNPDCDDDEVLGNYATELKDAIHGAGTDEETLLRILVSMNNEQRLRLASAYKQSFGEDLIVDIENDVGGDFRDFLKALLMSPREFDAYELNKAIKGPGTDERPLIEILATRSNSEIEEIKAIYKEKYDEELDEALASDSGGCFGRVMRSLVNGGREEGCADYGRAEEDAQKLYDAGIGMWGTDECDMNSILCLRSGEQLRAIFNHYEKVLRCGDSTVEEDIDSETSGDHQAGLLALVKVARDTPGYFADQLRKAMKGAGTWDNDLIRIIVSRSEIDLADIKDRFAEDGEDLFQWVKDDTGGCYQRGLLSIIQGQYIPPE